jgi:hypothetical protein
VISPSQRPPNTKTNIHALSGIRTDPSNQAAKNLSLRLRGHWDHPGGSVTSVNSKVTNFRRKKIRMTCLGLDSHCPFPGDHSSFRSLSAQWGIFKIAEK